jgi:hypothetical protein
MPDFYINPQFQCTSRLDCNLAWGFVKGSGKRRGIRGKTERQWRSERDNAFRDGWEYTGHLEAVRLEERVGQDGRRNTLVHLSLKIKGLTKKEKNRRVLLLVIFIFLFNFFFFLVFKIGSPDVSKPHNQYHPTFHPAFSLVHFFCLTFTMRNPLLSQFSSVEINIIN